MKVFTKIFTHSSKIEKIEIAHDLGIEIEHNGMVFRISVDNQDRLNLSTDEQLILKTRASNNVILEAE